MIDTSTFTVAGTVKTDRGAHGVAIDAKSRYVDITNSFADTVSVIDIAKRSVIAAVPVGKGPNGRLPSDGDYP